MKPRHYIYVLAFLSYCSCKKSVSPTPGVTPGSSDTTAIQPAVDPPVAGTIGFFLNDWQGRAFTDPAYMDTTLPASATTAITIDPSAIITRVPSYLFGNNTNPYMTPIVTQPSLMGHITDMNPRILRFPGGSISDVYFWNNAGTQPADVPDTMFDTNGNPVKAGYWYGNNTANWTMTVDNYYTLLQQTASTGIITINYAYARYGTSADPVAAAAHLAANWVRYDNGRTKYWEIGNEDGGAWEASYKIDVTKNHDGQPAIITGDLYGRHFKVFSDSMRAAAQQTGKTIYLGAQLLGTAPASWADATDQGWNTGVLARTGSTADFFIIHNYYSPYNTNSNAATILSSAATETQGIMSYLQQNTQSNNATLKPVALTEWNISATGSAQMSSFVAGMHAVLTVGELMKNKFGEASRWDLANGWSNGNDMGLFNAGDEPDGVPKWNPRPAFYYMYYFQKYLGDRLVSSTVSNNGSLASYASSFSSGQTALALVNTSATAQSVQLTVKNFHMGSRCYWYTLTGGTDNGEFSGKVFVNGQGPSGANGGPDNYATLKPYSALTRNGIRLNIPSRSVTFMVIDKQ
jgi:hypothetical protein